MAGLIAVLPSSSGGTEFALKNLMDFDPKPSLRSLLFWGTIQVIFGIMCMACLFEHLTGVLALIANHFLNVKPFQPEKTRRLHKSILLRYSWAMKTAVFLSVAETLLCIFVLFLTDFAEEAKERPAFRTSEAVVTSLGAGLASTLVEAIGVIGVNRALELCREDRNAWLWRTMNYRETAADPPRYSEEISGFSQRSMDESMSLMSLTSAPPSYFKAILPTYNEAVIEQDDEER